VTISPEKFTEHAQQYGAMGRRGQLVAVTAPVARGFQLGQLAGIGDAQQITPLAGSR
jgi:hypothetical protein